MTYEEALEILASDPHVWRYRQLVAEDFHDHEVRDAWRARVIQLATGQPEADRQVVEYMTRHGCC